ncbi:unnamed protein product [Chilo suppressalis]|uniref:Uncharacterized protein n=1 Tax=Chilo suppressalis TaxID=168631 RepID=A0ABN8B0L8_CHISP|nr:hypothetical protein evm_011606 [Chilo suppressalis]CAH0401219.1 unnamed protein product [Chilo suppressalis]
MTIVFVVLSLLPVLVRCSGDGNIRLLENEVEEALKSCTLLPDDSLKDNNARQRRSNEYTRIDFNDSTIGQNQYGHEKRNSTDMKEQMYVLNATYGNNDYEYGNAGIGNSNGEKFVSSAPRLAAGGDYNKTQMNANRTRRSEPLLNRPDTDQCLSQCIFANLQVVDSRGIPREAEFWNKVQSSVTSQQSRTALKDQTRACFQELQTEAEDNGCSYSNKLERCLMLRFADRKLTGVQQGQNRKT